VWHMPLPCATVGPALPQLVLHCVQLAFVSQLKEQIEGQKPWVHNDDGVFSLSQNVSPSSMSLVMPKGQICLCFCTFILAWCCLGAAHHIVLLVTAHTEKYELLCTRLQHASLSVCTLCRDRFLQLLGGQPKSAMLLQESSEVTIRMDEQDSLVQLQLLRMKQGQETVGLKLSVPCQD